MLGGGVPLGFVDGCTLVGFASSAYHFVSAPCAHLNRDSVPLVVLMNDAIDDLFQVQGL